MIPPDSWTHERPVAIDLFAGAGGLSLGLEQAGFDILVAVDYDPVHAAVHAFNFPSTVSLCASAATLKTERLMEAAEHGYRSHHPGSAWNGEVDLVAGGPPCQGFSTIGKRRVDDARNDLVFHFWRLVNEVRPRYFVMENVPGMAAGAQKDILADLVERFRSSGYTLHPQRILDASLYGVPQARRRLVLIGSRQDVPVAFYPEPTTRPAQRLRKSGTQLELSMLPPGPTVSDAISDLPNLDSFAQLLSSDSVGLSRAELRRCESRASMYAGVLRGSREDTRDLSHPRSWDPQLLTSSARTVHTSVSIQRFASTLPGTVEPVSRFLRLDPSGLCNTLRAGTGAERGAYTSPRPIHPMYARVISVREAARLHSFPDWFRLHATKWHGFRQIGNAVCPQLGRALGGSIVHALDARLERPKTPLALGSERLLHLTMNEAAREMGAAQQSMPGGRLRRASSAA
ncbi:MAG: DNA cytosine methyltransferase [Solirubrobacteraceae bacterium]